MKRFLGALLAVLLIVAAFVLTTDGDRTTLDVERVAPDRVESAGTRPAIVEPDRERAERAEGALGKQAEGTHEAVPAEDLETEALGSNLDRPGFLLLVEDEDGRPLAGARTEISYRPAFGDYRNETGITDAEGRVGTRVEAAYQFESIGVVDPRTGANLWWPANKIVEAPNRPRVARLRMTRLHRVPVRIRNLAGEPVILDPDDLDLDQEDASLADPFVGPLVGEMLGKLQYPEPVDPADATQAPVDPPLPFLMLEPGHWVADPGVDSLGPVAFEVTGTGHPQPIEISIVELSDCRRVDVEVVLPEGVEVDPTISAILRVGHRAEGVRYTDPLHQCGEFGRRLDRHGAFVMVPSIPYCELSVSGKGLIRAFEPIPPGATSVRVVMEARPAPPPVRTIEGVVVSAADGSRLTAKVNVGTRLRFGKVSGGSSGGAYGSFLPRPGEFSIKSARWPISLIVQAEGHACVRVGPFHEPPASPLKIELPVAYDLTGVVVDSAGQPVDSAVYLYRNGAHALTPSPSGPISPSYTLLEPPTHCDAGRRGTFRFTGVTRGEQKLRVVPEDHEIPPKEVHIAGDAGHISIPVGTPTPGTATLRGTVTSASRSEGLGKIKVWVQIIEDGKVVRTRLSVTKDNGTYCVHGLPPGRVNVLAGPQADSTHLLGFKRIEDLEVTEGNNVRDLRLPPRTDLFVRVLNGFGQAVPDAWVDVLDADGHVCVLQVAPGYQEGDGDETDRTGRANLPGIPAEPVTVRVWRDHDDREEGRSPILQQSIDLTQPLSEVVILSVPD